MRSHLFIHASLAVKNRRDLPSEILSTINNSTILELLLENMKGLTEIEKIVIVTSCSDCDCAIAEVSKKYTEKSDKFELLRIEQGKPFSFDEKNKTLEPDLLYKLPSYGFYSSELLKNYFAVNGIDTAVLITADDMPFIEPELIERLLAQYYKQGCFYGARHPGANLLVVPVESLSKTALCSHNLNQKLEDSINNIENDITQITLFNPHVDVNQVTINKRDFLTGKHQRTITVFDILYAFDVKKLVAKTSERYQFYPVYLEKDVHFLNKFFTQLNKLSLDEYDNVSKYLKDNMNKLVPSTLEIELTNRCNLKCSSCPHSILDREECDMTKEIFASIMDSFIEDIQYLVFSGFGEPALHPDLFEFIRTAKEKSALSVCLETNGTFLTEQFVNNLIDNKLDILTVNVDALDSFHDGDLSKSEAVIDMLHSVKKERKTEKPYLIIQTINSMSNQNRVQYYYKRWENIANFVLIEPFNDYCDTYDRSEQINLAPLTPIQECSKTSQSQLIFADGTTTLCKQKFNGFVPSNKKDLNEIWIDNYYRGNYFDFCTGCIMKYYRECVQPDKFNSSFQFKINFDILNQIDKAISQPELFYDEKNIDKTLSVFEKILRLCPDNPFIQEKLEIIEKQL